MIGTLIDKRYQVLDLIGRGGMGAVYRAEHVAIRRQVALKLLHPTLGRIADIGRRFEREAYAAGRIDHPNCVTVADFGKLEDGTLFLVMELCEGPALAEVLGREGRLAPRRALQVVRHLLRGLRHAHAAGIVHRDIKPENVILVEHDGDPEFAKLLDFGIAKLVGEAEQDAGGAKLTQAGVAFGTPTYMSPEQAWGKQIDARADLYSLTVMLFEMLVGQPPFVADDNVKLLSMHATRPPPRLSEAAPELAALTGLEAMVACGLAKEADERFADAAGYLDAVEAELAALGASGAAAVAAAPVAAVAAAPAVALGTAPTAWSMPTPVPPSAPVASATPSPVAIISPTATPSPMDTAALSGAYTPYPVHVALADPAKRRRRVVWGSAVGGVAGLVLILILASSGGDSAARGLWHEQRFEAAITQLQRGETCEERREAVAELRRLRDPRAVPALRDARHRMRGGVGPIGRRNANGCLRRDAESAIRFLEGL